MKHVLIGIAAAIVLLVAGITVAGYYLGLFGRGGPRPSPSPSPSVSPFPTTVLPTSTQPTTPVAPSPAAPAAIVSFQLVVEHVSGTGLSRTVTAQVSNTGSADAHNAWAKVEVFSQGQRVQVSGQDYLRVDIGTIMAGATANAQATLGFSLADGFRIQQNGAQVLLTIYSVERTQTLTYDYRP